MHLRSGLIGGAMLLAAHGGARAQVAGGFSTSTTVALHGAELVATVGVDPGPNESVGGYGALVQWDPAVLQFLGHLGGAPPFDSPVVNADAAAAGRVQFADAAAAAAPGPLAVIHLRFLPVAPPPAVTPLDLEFTSLFGGETFEDLLPGAAAVDTTACVADFAYDLRVRGGASSLLDWSPITAALSYDVLRGELAALSAAGATVDLGPVTCLENDSADTTTDAGTEPASPDTAVPALNRGAFYLVRFFDGASNSTAGFTPDCAAERTPMMSVCD